MKAMRPAARVLRRRRAQKHVAHLPGGGRLEQAATGGRLTRAGAPDERDGLAAARESEIERRKVAQPNPGTAEADREAGRRLGWQYRPGPGIAHAGDQAVRPHGLEQQHGRHVERLLQGPAHGHRALEGIVEILRLVGAEARRPVVDQGLRMREPVLEGETVDEGLQRRAGRSQRLGEVERARPCRVEQADAADMGANLAGGIVDGQHGDRDAAAERRGALAWRAPRAGPAGRAGSWCAPPCRRELRGRDARRDGRRAPGRAGAPPASPRHERRPPGQRRRHRRRGAERGRGRAPPWPPAASRSGRRVSGDCGSATSSAASAVDRRFGSLPK